MRKILALAAASLLLSTTGLIASPLQAHASISDCDSKKIDNPHPSTAKQYVIAKSRITCDRDQKNGYMWVLLYKCKRPIPGGAIDDRVFWMNKNCAVKQNKSGGDHFTIKKGKQVTRYAPPTGTAGFSKGGYFANYTIFGADGGTSYRGINTQKIDK